MKTFLRHGIVTAYACVVIPGVAIITFVVCLLEIVGIALCAPSAAWGRRMGWIKDKTPPE